MTLVITRGNSSAYGGDGVEAQINGRLDQGGQAALV